MKIIESKNGLFIPNLGIAAASFAAFLTILNLTERSIHLISATENFSIGIPLILLPLFLISFEKRFPSLHIFLLLLNTFVIYAGHLICLIGIYYCFLDISPLAASNFKFGAIIIFVVLFISGIISIILNTKNKKSSL